MLHVVDYQVHIKGDLCTSPYSIYVTINFTMARKTAAWIEKNNRKRLFIQ